MEEAVLLCPTVEDVEPRDEVAEVTILTVGSADVDV
jgi:hypothetical protein